MSRLYSDQLQSSGRRFYFALDGAPGIVTPAPAMLTMVGQVPAAAEQVTVFRTPATAILTMVGLSLGSPSVLLPGVGLLTLAGQIPAQELIRIITPAAPATVENPPNDPVPTLITIMTVTPAPVVLSLNALDLNVTQGGNIGFVSPAAAVLTLSSLNFTLLYGEAGVAALSIQGLVPTLGIELTITPEVGLLSLTERAPVLALPFGWVDDDPAPTSTWITDAAA